MVCAVPLGLCPAEANNMEMLGCLTPIDKTCGQSEPAETETEKPEPDGLERGLPGMGGSLATMPIPPTAAREASSGVHTWLCGEGWEWGAGGRKSLRIRANSLYQIYLVLQGGESQAQNAGNFLEIKE